MRETREYVADNDRSSSLMYDSKSCFEMSPRCSLEPARLRKYLLKGARPHGVCTNATILCKTDSI